MPCGREYPQSKGTGERLFRGRVTQFSGFLSIARLGGGLRRFRSGTEIRRFDGSETGSTERAQEVLSWAVGDQAGSAKPSSFSWADQLSGRSPRPVDRNWAVSSGG